MYDTPHTVTYSFPAVDLHTADITKILRGPKGKRGRLRDITADITTTTAGATTTPKIQVGINGTLTKFADWDLGAVTAQACKVASAQAPAVIKKNADYSEIYMDADTDVYLTLKAATGAGAAGVGDVYLTIDWF